MLFQQFRQDLVLGGQPRFQSRDALLITFLGGVPWTLQGRSAVFEELFEPVVEDGRLQLEFFAQSGNRNPVDQMPAQDRNLLFWGVMLAFLSHVSSSLCLA